MELFYFTFLRHANDVQLRRILTFDLWPFDCKTVPLRTGAMGNIFVKFNLVTTMTNKPVCDRQTDGRTNG